MIPPIGQKENQAHSTNMKARQHEIAKLQKKKRTQEVEFASLKRMHEKQEKVLRRKTEEVSAAQKRLRESHQARKTMQKVHQEELQDARSARHATTSRSGKDGAGSGSGSEVKQTLDRLLSVSLRVDTKRAQLESARAQRKATKIQMDEVSSEVLFCANEATSEEMQNEERRRKINECQAQLRVCSARISVLNNDLSQAKEELSTMDDVTKSFSSVSFFLNLIQKRFDQIRSDIFFSSLLVSSRFFSFLRT